MVARCMWVSLKVTTARWMLTRARVTKAGIKRDAGGQRRKGRAVGNEEAVSGLQVEYLRGK